MKADKWEQIPEHQRLTLEGEEQRMHFKREDALLERP